MIFGPFNIQSRNRPPGHPLVCLICVFYDFAAQHKMLRRGIVSKTKATFLMRHCGLPALWRNTKCCADATLGG